MSQTKIDILAHFVERLREKRAKDKAAIESAPSEPRIPPPAATPHYRLVSKPEETLAPCVPFRRDDNAPMELDELREQTELEIVKYLNSDSDSALLVRVPPGSGKSYLAVKIAQHAGWHKDIRTLYAAGRHGFWETLQAFPHFDPSLWYHWLPIGEETDERPETCRYACQMHKWLDAGYPSMELCFQLCALDGHLGSCPYRKQAKEKAPCIFGMHQHLVYGMGISDYEIMFIDEMPLSAFVKRTHISVEQICHRPVPRQAGYGPMADLFNALNAAARGAFGNHALRRRPLLDVIGPILADVYAQIEMGSDVLPEVPRVSRPEDVEALDMFYWPQLLETLSPEYECWSSGMPDWVGRIQVLPGNDPLAGLSIMSRHNLWEKAPDKVVILDATGTTEIYRAILGRQVETFSPALRRAGRLYQVVRRLNGSRTLELSPDTGPRGGRRWQLSADGREMLEQAEHIAGYYTSDVAAGDVGIVTHKRAVREFAAVFGADNVLHFGAARGSNSLEGKKAVIVAGGYCPPTWAMEDIAAALFPERLEPFGYIRDDGVHIPPWRPAWVEYKTTGGKSGWRLVGGFWDDYELKVIQGQSRQAEMLQALHRSRLNIAPVDVWVLTAAPLGEAVDGLFETLADTWLAPERSRDMNSGRYTGVPPAKWPTLRKWLDERWSGIEAANGPVVITANGIAEAAGVDVATVVSGQWLSSIAKHLPERWLLAPDHRYFERQERGRPRLVLQAVEVK